MSKVNHLTLFKQKKEKKKGGNFDQGCKKIEFCSIFFSNPVSRFSLSLTKILFSIK